MNKYTLFLLLITSIAYSQIGINTETPLEMLDVNGRVRVADSENEPAEGAIRYNGDFQGYDGNQWNSFTNVSKSIGYPTNRIYFEGGININSNSYMNLSFATFDSGNYEYYKDVPPGKYLLVTNLSVSYATFPSNNLNNNISVVCGNGTLAYPGVFLGSNIVYYNFKMSETLSFHSSHAPLFVIQPTRTFLCRNHSSSAGTAYVSISGFLVDDLEFRP